MFVTLKVCVCVPEQRRVPLPAHHTLTRGIVHSLSSWQAGRQKAAEAEDDRGEPLTGDTRILHRTHDVHHRGLSAHHCAASTNNNNNNTKNKAQKQINPAFFFLPPSFPFLSFPPQISAWSSELFLLHQLCFGCSVCVCVSAASCSCTI